MKIEQATSTTEVQKETDGRILTDTQTVEELCSEFGNKCETFLDLTGGLLYI